MVDCFYAQVFGGSALLEGTLIRVAAKIARTGLDIKRYV